ncbi:MAG TPA: OmpA family protein [Candidatus Syntrophosphaera sp.]|nr:OmpA family protein [Candidatus Syntrophosphaera sp.]
MLRIAVCLFLVILGTALNALKIGLQGERYARDGYEYYQRGDYDQAIRLYNLADAAAGGRMPTYHYWLGRLHIAVGDSLGAGAWFRKYLSSGDELYRQSVQDHFRILARQPKLFAKAYLRPMPDYFNSGNSDYGAITDPQGKHVYFTSLRPTRPDKENIWRAEIFRSGYGKPYLVQELSTDKNEAFGSFSEDSCSAWISGNYEKNKLDGDIYQVDYADTWSQPRNLSSLNSPQLDIQPMVFADRYLFFSSARTGGYGGTDLYVSELLEGEWSTPQNLGPLINTSANEQTPFLDFDGRTLYFASSGHPGFGGYDIFRAYKTGDSWQDWSLPENLGLPFNSPRNDRYFYHIPATNEGFLSSDRKVSGFEKIYRFTFEYPAQPSYIVRDEAGNLIVRQFQMPWQLSPEPEPDIELVPEIVFEPGPVEIVEPDPLWIASLPSPVLDKSHLSLEQPVNAVWVPLPPQPAPLTEPVWVAESDPVWISHSAPKALDPPRPQVVIYPPSSLQPLTQPPPRDLATIISPAPEHVTEPLPESASEPEPVPEIEPEPIILALTAPDWIPEPEAQSLPRPEPEKVTLPRSDLRPLTQIPSEPEPVLTSGEITPMQPDVGTATQQEVIDQPSPQFVPVGQLVRVQGMVTDQDGNPVLANVEITGEYLGMRTRNILITSSLGTFDGDLRWSDAYSVVVNEGGYLLYSDIIRLDPQTASLDLSIILRKLEKKKALAFGSVFFASDSALLSQTEKNNLDDVVLTLLNNPEVRVRVSGHAYENGTAKYNQDLSDRRARVVVDYLISKGIDKKRLSWSSYGKNQPLYGAVDPNELPKNRRVEIEVVK